MFAYYDPDADIAWFPTSQSDDVVSERVPGGLHDYDRTTRRLVAIEIWGASTRLPATILEGLPAPGPTDGPEASDRGASDALFEGIRKRLGTEPGTLADFETEHGSVQPPDGEG